MTVPQPNSFRTGPDERGHFGLYGGRFVAETLMPLVLELEQAYAHAKADPVFKQEMNGYLTHYVGRPSPLYLTPPIGAWKPAGLPFNSTVPVAIRRATRRPRSTSVVKTEPFRP